MANLTDAALHKLLTTPRDSRPGLLDKKSRLKNLKKLSVKNTEVGDISLRYLTQYLPQLTSLALAGCWKLTDAGLAMLGQAEDSRLSSLDISYCMGVTDSGLGQLGGCKLLDRVETTGSGVTQKGLDSFIGKKEAQGEGKVKLKVYGQVIDKRQEVRSSTRSRKDHRSSKK